MSKDKNNVIKFESILKNQVTITNLVARSAQGLSLREKRLVFIGISKVDSRPDKYTQYVLRTTRITAKEYAELAQIDENNAYKEIKEASENLFNRYLSYPITTPKGIMHRKIRWVEAALYHEGEGWVEYTFSQAVMPHLCMLKSKFTKYRLEQASGIRSIYSWRLLEILTSHQKTITPDEISTITITLDKFCQNLEIPESYKYKDIRVRVIESAVTELNQKDNWLINWKPIKKGRAVYALKFSFSRNPQTSLFDQT